MGIPKFNDKDLDGIHKYLVDWNKWRKEKKVGLPDYTNDTIMLLPLIITLLKSEERLEKLTWVLIFLTIILATGTFLLLLH